MALLFNLCVPPSLVVASSSPSDDARLDWWRDARLGLFIHWGAYAVAGDGEWVMHNKRITVSEYERDFPPAFNPVKFDAEAWVRLAQGAGLRYVVLIAKHMDGFCLWATRQTDYNIMQSPFRRDIVRELARIAKQRPTPTKRSVA